MECVSWLIYLVLFAQRAVAAGEHAGFGIAGQNGQYAPLPAGALADIAFFDQRLVAVIGNCVKVQIKDWPPPRRRPSLAAA